MPSNPITRFRLAYAEHRRREGHDRHEPSEFPYIHHGPLRKMWSVRVRSYETVVKSIIRPFEHEAQRALTIMDLGAGNGWFSLRMRHRGHCAVAVDLRSDQVDGLGAARDDILRAVADFAWLPFRDNCADISLFNASLHYATSVEAVLRETRRITRVGGRIVIVDTPFYNRREDGMRMVAEKRANSHKVFANLAADLTAIHFVEFLTQDDLEAASQSLGLKWTRHQVRYPLWYELRPLIARLRRRRPPSRFDVWEGIVSD